MLIVVSPAKKMDMDPVAGVHATSPAFQAQANELAGVARKLSAEDLKKLMKISENLGRLNADRFRNFGEMEKKAAALAFAGDTYQGLEAASLEADELAYAQEHLRILSGLYGVLRPLDAIEPYRLEMGSRLKTKRGKSLYDYWGDEISKALNAQAKQVGTDLLVNCASQEYFGAVAPGALNLRVITPVFMEKKAGQAKIVSFYAKKARGAMARFVVQNRLRDADALKDFDTGGYVYDAGMSKGDAWVFLRDYPAA